MWMTEYIERESAVKLAEKYGLANGYLQVGCLRSGTSL